jgi:hypothetical protein
MGTKVNFIAHFNETIYRISKEENFNPSHVSIYFALIAVWNSSFFKKSISINRQELKNISKVGSNSIYTKCLKDLQKRGYIIYKPSKNPLKGSEVEMLMYYAKNQPCGRRVLTLKENSTETVLIPYINSKNNTNNKNSFLEKKLNDSDFDEFNKKKRKKVAPKKEKNQQHSKSPSYQEVANYFASKLCSKNEGEKFFNYFESNGWLVGGKTPMKNWHAAANNWIINIDKFKNNGTHKQESKSGASAGQNNSRAGSLHATSDKNFSEPL